MKAFQIMSLFVALVLTATGCGKNEDAKNDQATDLTATNSQVFTGNEELETYPSYCGWVDSIEEDKDKTFKYSVKSPLGTVNVLAYPKVSAPAIEITVAAYKTDSLLCFCFSTNSGYGSPFWNSYQYAHRAERVKRTISLSDFNEYVTQQKQQCAEEDIQHKSFPKKVEGQNSK